MNAVQVVVTDGSRKRVGNARRTRRTKRASMWAVMWMAMVLGVADLAAAAEREERVELTPGRAVAVRVPAGFVFEEGTNSRGEPGAMLTDEKRRLSLTLVFEPDPEGEYLEARGRTERLFREFGDYVAGSVERAMQFAELEPAEGAGTLCTFTDAKLAGRPASEYPPGEYLHLTVGVKAWRGVAVRFMLFSNDTDSEGYRAVLRLLRESVHEKPVAR